jgi:hypothetical protein
MRLWLVEQQQQQWWVGWLSGRLLADANKAVPPPWTNQTAPCTKTRPVCPSAPGRPPKKGLRRTSRRRFTLHDHVPIVVHETVSREVGTLAKRRTYGLARRGDGVFDGFGGSLAGEEDAGSIYMQRERRGGFISLSAHMMGPRERRKTGCDKGAKRSSSRGPREQFVQ